MQNVLEQYLYTPPPSLSPQHPADPSHLNETWSLSAGLVLKPEDASRLVSCLLLPAGSSTSPRVTYGSGLAQAFRVGDFLQILSGKHT